MRSNSKLSRDLKNTMRAMLLDLQNKGGDVFCFPDVGVTVAIRPAGQGIEGYYAAVSVADGKTEKKFRPSVGKLYAMDRLVNGQAVFIANPDGINGPYDSANDLAYACGSPTYWGDNDNRDYTKKGLPFYPHVWEEMAED